MKEWMHGDYVHNLIHSINKQWGKDVVYVDDPLCCFEDIKGDIISYIFRKNKHCKLIVVNNMPA